MAKRAAAAAAAEPPAQQQQQPDTEARFFLLKSEPDLRLDKGVKVSFSLADLEASPGRTSDWTGVRNYAARNVLRELRVGDRALFYHSSCKTPGVVAEVVCTREAYPDPTADVASGPYFDAKQHAKPGEPRWVSVDVRLERRLAAERLTLAALKAQPALASMELLTRPRLSCQRVSPAEYAHILRMAGVEEAP